jgi:hypothetical protein
MKCDVPGCSNNADVLISNLHDGSTQALCVGHFNECILATAENLKRGIDERKKEREKAKTTPKTTKKLKDES